MVKFLALLACVSACAVAPVPQATDVPGGYADGNLWQVPNAEACDRLAQRACPESCGEGCYDQVWATCDAPGSVTYPSKRAAEQVWSRCLADSPRRWCGQIPAECAIVTPPAE